MLKKSCSGMKKVLVISLAVLFVVSFTAVTASAEREGHPGHPCHGGFDVGGCGGSGWGGGGSGYGCGYPCGYPCVLVPYCGYIWSPCTNMFVWTC